MRPTPRFASRLSECCHAVSIFLTSSLYTRMSVALVGLGNTTSLLRGIGGVMRVVVVAAAISLSIVGLSLAEDARASIRRPTNIPAEPLAPALKQLAHERAIQVVFQTEVVGATQTHGAAGELTTAEALTQLLEGT